jgi:hypothetical protein
MPTEQPANAISFVAAEVELRGDSILWILLQLVARALEVCVCVWRERERERQTDRQIRGQVLATNRSSS